MTTKSRNGRIITFYSYKGGTGRTMALANVGWILASAGKRVLLIDWDFEAPGLHRYLHPFLEDKELASTPGLIDFFVTFATASRSNSSEKPSWFAPYVSLVPYTTQLQWEFPNEGTLELVPAGKQDAAYAMWAMSFEWQHFYEHGGGIFLEAVKQQLRHDYDYILIDSRTGISDTSGICTVQMPDELVVLFTLNQQSIKGAAGIAESADRQRRTADGRPGLKIWPVPTRVEMAEQAKLEAAREQAKNTFDRFIARLSRTARTSYWDDVQVLYQPFYAYEEMLAPFAEKRKRRGSMLDSMETVASLLTPGPLSFPVMPEELRREVLTRFEQRGATSTSRTIRAFASYSRDDEPFISAFAEVLADVNIDVPMAHYHMDNKELPAFRSALERSDVILYFIGPSSLSRRRKDELAYLLREKKQLIPILVKGAFRHFVPDELQSHNAFVVEKRLQFGQQANALRAALDGTAEAASLPMDPEDPQKGLWGGDPRRDGLELTATVAELSDEWFEVTLDVHSTTSTPLTGSVEFHLHPTFTTPQTIAAHDGHATLTLSCWGAFTVGAVAGPGRTTLELDLAADPRFPKAFREH
ncbi:MAG TPA: AAA family ATPase [Thermoanaerobaculia bacterium]